MNLNQKVTLSPDVISQEVSGETVLLDLESENYFGLDEVGTRIWQVIKETEDLQEIYDTLLQEYEVEEPRLQADLEALLGEVSKLGLVSLEARSEQAAKVFRKGMNDPASLSKDEAMQFIMNVHSVMLAYQSNYFLGAEGTLDADMNNAMSSALEAAAPTPGFGWYWQQRGGHFTEEFRGFVDQIITSHPEGGAEIYK